MEYSEKRTAGLNWTLEMETTEELPAICLRFLLQAEDYLRSWGRGKGSYSGGTVFGVDGTHHF